MKKILVFISLMATVLVTWAIIQTDAKRIHTIPRVKPAADTVAAIKYSPILLITFRQLCKKLDGSVPEYMLAGRLSSANKADSTDNVYNIDYMISKKGEDLYYKLGNTETINAEGKYLYIDHEARIILLSAQKKVNVQTGLTDAGEIAGKLQSENYELLSETKGPNKIIRMINENHISCKEYAITYDTLTMRPLRIYSRLSGDGNASGKNADKTVDIQINTLSIKSETDRHKPGNIIKKTSSGWIPAPEYKGFRLVEM